MRGAPYAAAGEDWAGVPLALDAGLHEVWVERDWKEIPGFDPEMSLLRL